jgi:hypothetical protein
VLVVEVEDEEEAVGEKEIMLIGEEEIMTQICPMR